MKQPNQGFPTPPRTLSEDAFVDRFGPVYEHSPWIARDTWRRGLSDAQDSVAGLAAALAATVETAGAASQLALIRAHPELGARRPKEAALTPESTHEQASAGLDHCPTDEAERFQTLNTAYRRKFGFPFVMAVKGRSRARIMAALQQRLDNDADTEKARALSEIHKIARLRLDEIAKRR